MTREPSQPPRLAEWLLARRLGRAPAASYLLADLREEFARMAERHPRLAGLWYLRQAAGLALGYRRTRRTTAITDQSRPTFGDLMRNHLTLAVRSLARRPVVSFAIVATIGGALAAMSISFGLVNGVLLRPLPYVEPDRLVTIWERSLVRDEASRNVTSPANLIAWREQLTTVTDLVGVFETSSALTGDGNPEQIGVVIAAGPLFELLGATPLAGRFFRPEEDVAGGPNAVVISEGLWHRRFGDDPGLIGRSIQINGSGYEVIGVVPDRFDFAPAFSWGAVGQRDAYLTARLPAGARTAGGRYLQVVGRLTPGATVASAQTEASALAARLRDEFPDRQRGWDVNLRGLHEDMVGDVRTPVTIVFAAVTLVLLIACANVANLLLARATERRGELAIRSALGAGRGTLARQLFSESAVLALAGGVVGIGLSVVGIGALVRSAPDLPRIDAVTVDAGVIGFALLATAIVACLIGIGPALEAAGRGPATGFGIRGAVSDRVANRARRSLVGVQVALSVVLVIGAGLLVRSLLNRLTVDLGVRPDNLLTAEITLPNRRYPTAEQRSQTIEALVERLAAMPGVAAVGATSIVPMTDKGQATGFFADDRPVPEAGQFPVADVRFVQHGYLDAIGTRVLAGRGLEAADGAGAPVVVLINETGARQLWPDGNAVGKRITMEWGDTLRAEIVGVVADVRLGGPDTDVRRATLYWDYRQLGVPGNMALVVRGVSNVPAASLIRTALADIDPNVPVYNVSSLTQLRDRAVARSRFITGALGLFSALALALAALGVYGVMAYGVQQRTREIGVRLALGADRRQVIRMVLAEGGRVIVPALVVGGAAALLLSRFLRSLVFGVSPYDPLALGAGLGLISLVALGACWIPARRASGIAPVEAIRTD